MGRKYIKTNVYSNGNSVKDLKGLLDTGSDITVISNKVKEKLNLKLDKEREIVASDGHTRYMKGTKLIIEIMDKKAELGFVIVDDNSLDLENDEEVIIGLDFMQKVGMKIKFEKEF